jgi:hypothetical protein
MSSNAPEATATQQQSTQRKPAAAPPAALPAKKKEGKPEEEKKQAPSDQKSTSEFVAERGADKSEAKATGNRGNRKANGGGNNQIGTGASLLNRKVRGIRDGGKNCFASFAHIQIYRSTIPLSYLHLLCRVSNSSCLLIS